MGLGLLFAGLSGAGKGLADSAEQAQKVYDERALMEERARLEEEKLLRIDQVRSDRARSAGVKQGQDIGTETRRLQNERDAAAINSREGSSMTAEDAQVLRDKPEARKAYGLLGASRTTDLEDRATSAENLGYLDAARETRGMLQTETANQRNADLDASTNRRLDVQEKNAKFAQEYQMRRESRMDRLAESQLTFQKARAEKEDARSGLIEIKEQRAATSAALRGANDDIKSLQKEAADPMLEPEQKAIVDDQLKEARSEAARYREALAAVGVPGSKPAPKPNEPTKAPYPDGTKLRKGGSTYVVKNGIPVLEGK